MDEVITDCSEIIAGLGIDIVENTRIKDMLERWPIRFRERVFLPGEQSYCDSMAEPWVHFAARFAAKEAVFKAFGTGVSVNMSWLDVEILRDSRTGSPSVVLSPRAATMADDMGVCRILVSLSHTTCCSVAQAVLVGHRHSIVKRT